MSGMFASRHVVPKYLLLATLFLAVPCLNAQIPTLQEARRGVVVPPTPLDPPFQPAQPERCMGKRMVNVAAGALAGAALGSMFFAIGVGALSADKGETYKRDLRRHARIGAYVVGAYSLGRSVLMPCDRLFR